VATKQGNQITLSIGSGSEVTLPQGRIRFDAGKKCARIRARISVVMANSSTAYNMTAANLITLLSACVANFRLNFGTSDAETVDTTLPFAMMRLMYAMMEGKDFFVSVGSGTPVQINTVSGSTIQIAATPTLTTLNFEFLRSFTIKKALSELHTFCPGYTQMQQIDMGITPSASAAPTFNTGDVTVNAPTAIPCEILFEELEADSDQWANCPRIRQASPSAGGQTIPLPVESGASIIAIADLSSGASGYGLTLFEITDPSPVANGGQPVYVNGLASFAQTFAAYEQDLFNGDYDWSAQAAPLYTIPTANDVEHLDSVGSLQFYQPNNDLSAPQICVCYVPAFTPGSVNRVGTNALGMVAQPLKLTNAVGSGSLPPSTPSQVAAVLPLQIQKQQAPAFATAPGQLFAPNSAPSTDIPAPVLAAAQGAANAQPGGASSAAGSAQLAKSTKSITNAVPGFAQPGKRTGPTNAHLAVASTILGHGVTTAAGQATAKSQASALTSRLFATTT
jgi:hypothetical protein